MKTLYELKNNQSLRIISGDFCGYIKEGSEVYSLGRKITHLNTCTWIHTDTHTAQGWM